MKENKKIEDMSDRGLLELINDKLNLLGEVLNQHCDKTNDMSKKIMGEE